MKKNKISIIGFMGSGKTTVGLLLSKSLNFSFIDLDDYIEKKEGKSIKEIFFVKGEEYFRERESFYLKEVIKNQEKIVIATGGGIIKREENRIILKEKTFVVYLKGDFSVLMQRLNSGIEKEKRPLLSLDVDELYNLWISRKPLYESIPDLIIDIENKSPFQIVEEILNSYEM